MTDGAKQAGGTGPTAGEWPPGAVGRLSGETRVAGEPAATRTLSEAGFAVPAGDRYFEDYLPGPVYCYGWATVHAARSGPWLTPAASRRS